jgi:energy-coupling factor transporter ATP-binding protein EcfA2
MIRKLTIRGFKSIRDAVVPFGPLTAFVGANASGKSNLLEAIRVVQGMALGYSVRDVLDGRHEEVTRSRWPGVRGGSKWTRFMPDGSGTANGTADTVDIEVEIESENVEVSWALRIDPQTGTIRGESLRKLGAGKAVYDTAPVEQAPPGSPFLVARVYKGKGGGGGNPPQLQFSSTVAILTQLHGENALTTANEEFAATAARLLSDVQFLDPSPDILREYALPGARRLGDRGELFASVVEALSKDPKTKEEYVSWLQNLTPTQISDLHFFKTELGQLMFGVRENGLPEPIPALSLSDGTLRFAVIAASLFQPDPPGVLLIEEIENGVNATRLRLLAEMLRQRSETGKPQVLVTTHSPLLLAYLPEDAYRHVIWCWRNPSDGSTSAMPVTDVPHFREVIRRTPLNELFAQGWLEAAL